MRPIRRDTLTPETLDFLWKRRLKVVAAGERHPHERETAQYEEAERLWHLKDNKAFREIRGRLRDDMAPGDGHCMYCQYGFGNAIDHFRPMQKYPTRAFEWDNYVWSCTICNTDYKGTQFPLDRNGLPLLIDPTRDDPREHLQLSPREGKLVGVTPKGVGTIDVFGFEERGELDKARAAAWRGVQGLLVLVDEAFARGDRPWLEELRRDLSRDPLASLLALLIAALSCGVRRKCAATPRTQQARRQIQC
jgi:uncharacterized protein (TIGR02646 family)